MGWWCGMVVVWYGGGVVWCGVVVGCVHVEFDLVTLCCNIFINSFTGNRAIQSNIALQVQYHLIPCTWTVVRYN